MALNPEKEKLVNVRTLHGTWVENPKKGTFGEPDTVKIPRGTEIEMSASMALDHIERGLVERVK